MRNYLPIGMLCFVAACSGSDATTITDARSPDHAPSVDSGARQDGLASEVETAHDLASLPTDGLESPDEAALRPEDATVIDTAIDRMPLDTSPDRAAVDTATDQLVVETAADRPALDTPADRPAADAPIPDLPSDPVADAIPDLAVSTANLYFVSPSGNDSTGDGSAAHPWKTITASARRIDYSLGLPTLHLAAGTYDEKVLLHDSIMLQGTGEGRVTVKNSATSDTDYVITVNGSAPTVAGAVVVTITGLRVDGLAAKNRGIYANQATLKLDDVNVYQPSAYGIAIGPNITGFVIDHTTVGFEGMLYSDVGIDVGNGSTGSISHFKGGDHIDHIINIGLGCTVDIADSQLTGSPIWYADGIRIQGASNVTIRNTTIVRPAGSDLAASGPAHNPPYAAVEVAASSNGNRLVTIDGCTLRGFDVGIGVNLMFNALLAQNNSITGNLSAEVRTVWAGSLPSQYPVVDLGGGSLGSVGKNDFGTGAEYAIDLGGPYDVSAKNNLWSGTDIETRLRDRQESAALGRVQY